MVRPAAPVTFCDAPATCFARTMVALLNLMVCRVHSGLFQHVLCAGSWLVLVHVIVHVANHAVWIVPKNSDRIGGILLHICSLGVDS